jgi:hypothetical protein
MVGLQTLDLAIGVRVPASQLSKRNKLRAAYGLPVLALCHSCITALRGSYSRGGIIRQLPPI